MSSKAGGLERTRGVPALASPPTVPDGQPRKKPVSSWGKWTYWSSPHGAAVKYQMGNACKALITMSGA